jgi:two-component system KDP operon response regulator KdpE
MTRVLVVDDDRQLLRALQITLTARGYVVVPAATGAAALAAASASPPEVVILDLGLPDLDGVAVIEGLRGWCTAPVIVLSARHEERAKVRALDAGADDYVTKPFGMEELLARLRAAVRRTMSGTSTATVTTEAFTVDLAARRVMAGQDEIRLTPTEWHLLELLVRNAGNLLTQRQLLQQVWGPSYGTETNYLRVHIANLRRKLEPDPSRPRYLITEPGIGYRFMPGPDDAA